MQGSSAIAGADCVLVERIERIEEEIKGLNDDKKDIFMEAKGEGFDGKILRAVVGSESRTRTSATNGTRYSRSICTRWKPAT